MSAPPPTDLVAISGAGLVGSLLAIFLRRRGFRVIVYEARADMRKETVAVHRSINLVITSRGRYAVRQLGLEDDVMRITVPVVARAIHARDGTVTLQPYGMDDSERNYSVSRSDLNMLLMNKAEQEGVQILFEHRLVDVDIPNRTYTFSTPKGARVVCRPHVLFGCDGAGAASRTALFAHLVRCNPETLEFTTDRRAHLEHHVRRLGVSYRELLFPKSPGKGYTFEAWGRKQEGYPLDPRYLHIWPRGSQFLMGLPNQEGSVTGTLYLPDDAAAPEQQGEPSFDKMRSTEDGLAYMRREYPDAVPHLGDLAAQWKANPSAWLASVFASHWIYEDKLCLVGDAGHAITPFFGQGMNSGFEDCTDLVWVLDSVGISPRGGDWARALRWYQRLRKSPCDDLADMAEENYQEMAAKVGDSAFLYRKQLEAELRTAFPQDFRSRYWMITNTLIPYDWVRQAGRIIDNEVLDPLCADTGPVAPGQQPAFDLPRARELITQHLTPFLRSKGIDFADPWKFYTNRTMEQLGCPPARL